PTGSDLVDPERQTTRVSLTVEKIVIVLADISRGIVIDVTRGFRAVVVDLDCHTPRSIDAGSGWIAQIKGERLRTVNKRIITDEIGNRLVVFPRREAQRAQRRRIIRSV